MKEENQINLIEINNTLPLKKFIAKTILMRKDAKTHGCYLYGTSGKYLALFIWTI